jgi:hypothetical protein
MEKYRIVKKYDRYSYTAKITHYYIIEKYVMIKNYFGKRYVWETVWHGFYSTFTTLKEAKAYLKNLQIPVPQDEVIN